MFRRLVQRFNAVPTPKLTRAGVGVVVFVVVFPRCADACVDWYFHRLKQKALKDTSGRRDERRLKQNALKDTSGRRDGH